VRERAWLVVATLACFLVACTRVSYVYVALTGDNVMVVEIGEPRHSYWRFGGDPIPIRYSVSDPSASLTISVGSGTVVPDLIIESSLPIRVVEASHRGSANRRSEFQYIVMWSYWPEPYASPVHVGDSIELKIYLENRTDPVRVTGTIMTSGTIIYSDGL
jgi:hypothetical protein